MKIFALSIIVVLAVLSSGCASDDVAFQHIGVVDATHIAVYARDGHQAIIDADGGLRIDDRDVATTPAQRDLVRRYYAAAGELRSRALATGAAGAATGLTAIKSVAGGLASGHPDQIGPQVEAQAAKVEASAVQVCQALAQLRAVQDDIAAQIAAFKPFATITPSETQNCAAKS